MKGGTEIKRNIKFVVVVEQPQFNLQYLSKDSQMLLASRKNCTMIIFESCLPYDKFRQDLKYTYKACFKNLECFVAPTNIDIKNNAFWLDSDSLANENDAQDNENNELKYSLRQGLLLRIISCDRAFFNYNGFDLDQCEIDFSKPIEVMKPNATFKHFEEEQMYFQYNNGEAIENFMNEIPNVKDNEDFKNKILQQNQAYMWKNEPRINSLIVKIDKLTSYMDSYGLSVFRNIMLDFVILLLSSNKAKLEELELNQQMFNEFKHVGRKNLSKYIQSRLAENDSVPTRKKSKFEYSISKCCYSLTKDESPFINLSIEELFGSTTIYTDDSNDFVLQIKSIDIANLLEDKSDYNMILTKLVTDPLLNSSNKGPMFYLKNHSYFVPGIANAAHKWRVYEIFEIKGSNVVVKLTEDIYQKIYEYFFQEDVVKDYKESKQIVIVDKEKKKKCKSAIEEFSV